MKRLFSAAVCCLIIIFALFGGLAPAYAENGMIGESVGNAGALADGIIEYKVGSTGAGNVREWIENELSENAGVMSDWYVIALAQSGKDYDFSSYTASLRAYISENGIPSAVTRQRIALSLIACGCFDDPFVVSTANDSIGKQGIMSWIFGLHLLGNGCKSDEYTASAVIDMLLSLRLSDGGWALMGSSSDVDVTAMALTALAPYYEKNGSVKTAVDEALTLLSGKQLSDGGFKGFGAENPESTSQVIVALSSLGLDASTDSRFIKDGKTLFDGVLRFRLESGAFCHSPGGDANESASYQALCAFISAERCAKKLSPLFVFRSGYIPGDISDPDETSQAEETSYPDETSHSDETSFQDSTEISVTSDTAESVAGESISEEISPESSDESEEKSAYGYKLWASLTVLGAASAVCIILWICKKRHFKNFIFVLLIALLAIAAILTVNFRSTEDYYRDPEPEEASYVGKVTLTIRCDTIVGKADSEYIPSDGTILPATEFSIGENESVFDVLVRAAKKYGIQMENKGSSAHGMTYISGINYLYEFQFGDLSGWIYHVNGVSPSVGCGEYMLHDGDSIEWLYSCELGNDLD